MINEIVDFKVERDELLWQICISCSLNAQIAFRFKRSCECSQYLLTSKVFKQSSSTVDSGDSEMDGDSMEPIQNSMLQQMNQKIIPAFSSRTLERLTKGLIPSSTVYRMTSNMSRMSTRIPRIPPLRTLWKFKDSLTKTIFHDVKLVKVKPHFLAGINLMYTSLSILMSANTNVPSVQGHFW